MKKSSPTVARVTDAIDTLVLVCGKGVAWLILPMVLSLVWEVTARYGFNAPTEWAYDMTFMLYGTFFMLARRDIAVRRTHPHRLLLFQVDAAHAGARRPRLLRGVLFPGHCDLRLARLRIFWKSFQQNERIVTSPWLPIVWPFVRDARFRRPAAAAGHFRIHQMLGSRVRARRGRDRSPSRQRRRRGDDMSTADRHRTSTR